MNNYIKTTFFVSYNQKNNMWEVLELNSNRIYGLFKKESEAFEYCGEMNY